MRATKFIQNTPNVETKSMFYRLKIVMENNHCSLPTEKVTVVHRQMAIACSPVFRCHAWGSPWQRLRRRPIHKSSFDVCPYTLSVVVFVYDLVDRRWRHETCHLPCARIFNPCTQLYVTVEVYLRWYECILCCAFTAKTSFSRSSARQRH